MKLEFVLPASPGTLFDAGLKYASARRTVIPLTVAGKVHDAWLEEMRVEGERTYQGGTRLRVVLDVPSLGGLP